MTEKVRKYREKHKRCKYCEHLQIVVRKDTGSSFYECTAKDKFIRDMLPNMRDVPRLFCQCYEVKDDE